LNISLKNFSAIFGNFLNKSLALAMKFPLAAKKKKNGRNFSNRFAIPKLEIFYLLSQQHFYVIYRGNVKLLSKTFTFRWGSSFFIDFLCDKFLGFWKWSGKFRK
jgi:hypothetical protein